MAQKANTEATKGSAQSNDNSVRNWKCTKCKAVRKYHRDFSCDHIGFRYVLNDNLSYGVENQGLTTDFSR